MIGPPCADPRRRQAQRLRAGLTRRNGLLAAGAALPGTGARFFHNGTLRGEVRDAEFARLFFGIWLSPNTSGRRCASPCSAPGLPGDGAVTAPTLPAAPTRTGWRGGWAQGLTYGGLGLPLAFVALPLYVILPNHYASEFGIPLATLGALLLGARLLDAVADPWIGRWVDGWLAMSAARLLAIATAAAVLLALGLALLARAPQPRLGADAGPRPGMSEPLATPAFRRLLLIYLVNGVASAVPATLVLFFIRDRLQAPAFEPLFLASYFAAGALSMPLWLRLVARWGLARTWLAGMLLAIVTFAWAAMLGAGDVVGFTLVCIASGVALGADLTLPGALLAGVIQRAGHGQRLEGGYFGWWNFATKLNLALAAGIALPLLGQFGYAPGGRDEASLQALTVAYCLLPCAPKLMAAALLYTRWIRPEQQIPIEGSS